MSIPADPPISAPLHRLPDQNDNLQTSEARAGINGAKFDANNDGPSRGCLSSMSRAIKNGLNSFMSRFSNMSLPSFSPSSFRAPNFSLPSFIQRNNNARHDIGEIEQVVHKPNPLNLSEVATETDDTDSVLLKFDETVQTDRPIDMKAHRGNVEHLSVLFGTEDYNETRRLLADEDKKRQPSTLTDRDGSHAVEDEHSGTTRVRTGRDEIPSVLLSKTFDETPIHARDAIPSVLVGKGPTDRQIKKAESDDAEAADILQSKAHKERKDDTPKTDEVTTDILQSKAHKEGKEVAQKTESLTDILQSKAHKERGGDV